MRHSLLAAAMSCASMIVLASCQTPEAPVAPVAPVAAAPAAPAAPPAAPVQTGQSQSAVQQVAGAVSSNPGEAVYKTFCAMCHDNPDTKSPTRENLAAMNEGVLNFALTEGKMKVQGAGLSTQQRADLISWLTAGHSTTTADWTTAMMCTGARAAVDLGGPSDATSVGFGFTHDNNRKLTAKQSGLTTAKMADMELAWSIAIPGGSTMRSQGAIVGDNLFWPATDISKVFAFDIGGDKPCIQWIYSSTTGAPLRTSTSYGVLADGTPLLVIAGQDGVVHALDPRTGKAMWTKNVASYSYSMTTGTPVILKDRLIVPVAQFEIMVAADNKEKCCTNHGYMLSLDPKTGAQQWRYDTMPDATPTRDRGDGQMLLGPSGAPIWNSPSVDEKRGLIYFGTGESNSPPAHKNTNAVIAIDLKTGKEKWSFHATPNDIFNAGCGPNPKPEQLNCVRPPETVYRDVDFGASMIIGKGSDGKDLIYAGQKSGSVWAFNPDTGKVVWRTPLGTGGPLGGVHWGLAFDNNTLFAPITSVGVAIPGEWEGDPNIKPGLYALDAKTGKIKWQFNPTAPEGAQRWRGNVFSTAPTVIDGAVVTGALDGTLYINDAKTGKALWSYQTAKEFQATNGVKGKGGAIDSNSITAANGLLLVNSGYGMFGQAPGNMLLAFKPKS